MNIQLTYKLRETSIINEINLCPEEYFESIEQNENFEDDGIAKYNEEWFYILDLISNLKVSDFEFTTVELRGSLKSDFLIKTNHYGNDTIIIYRKDKNGYELMIQSLKIAKNCLVITRMERENSTSEWININLNTGVNYNKNDENEKWYSLSNGEIMDKFI